MAPRRGWPTPAWHRQRHALDAPATGADLDEAHDAARWRHITKQITLRSIPEDLQLAIESQARAHGESLNRSAIRLLKQAVGLDRPSKKKRDLSAIAGRWSARQAEEFESNLCLFEAIDEELWQ